MKINLRKILFGGLLLGSLTASSQVVLPGANGSAASLIPLSASKKELRKMAGIKTLRTDYTKSENQYFIVAYDIIPSTEVQKSIGNVANYVSYIPPFTYIYVAKDASVAMKAITSIAQVTNLNIKGSGIMPWEFKLGESLYNEYKQNGKLSANITNDGVEVSVFSEEDFEPLKTTLEEWQCEIVSTENNRIHIRSITLEVLQQIAMIPYVNYIEQYVEPTEENTPPGVAPEIRYIMQTNAIDIVNYDRKGPIGNGVIYMNWENYGGEHYFPIAAYGRTLPGDLGDSRPNGHGTTVGVISAGANNLDEWQTGGMAPGMTYLSNKTYGINAAGAERALAANRKPLVSNYSVGFGKGNVTYDSEARELDRVAFNSNAYICFYSAGNDSSGKLNGYTKTGYSTITGGRKTSKNNMTIHGTGHPASDMAFTSFGPTKDGRMKPDISAQGSAGTSFASPGVAGLAGALMEQYATTYNTAARADVAKGVILNSALRVRSFNALDAGEERVDTINHITYRSGFGQINPMAAVETIKNRNLYIGSPLIQGQANEHVVQIPAGQTEARFMLYYNDSPGTVGATLALVNDLDLEVVAPDGTTYLPWTLDPSVDKVHLPPTRKVNRRDNVEQVVITANRKGETLPAGAYRLRVRGHAIPNRNQSPEYVLVWQSRERGIRLTSLPENYRVATGSDLLISWEFTVPLEENKLVGGGGNFSIVPTVQYRTAPGQAWRNVPVHKNTVGANYYLVKVTDAMESSKLQFRVKLGDDMEAISNNVHVTERVVERPVITDFSSKHATLEWKAPTTVNTGVYHLYALYDKYMTELGTVNFPNTTGTIQAPEGVTFDENTWFAVSYTNGKTKARSQRTIASALTQANRYSSSETWYPLEYKLCVDDVIKLPTIATAGHIQWYKLDGTQATAIPAEQGGTQRTFTFTSAMAGQYYYTASSLDKPSEVFYTSPVVTIDSPDLNPSYITKFGDFEWSGCAFYYKDANAGKQLKDQNGLPFYGRFTLKLLGFNSHDKLFKWNNDDLTTIPGYIGCNTPENRVKHLIVMKRKGFEPGRYTFTIHRAAQRARLIFRDRLGNIVRDVHTKRNSGGEPPISIDLDENSSVELQWIGEHFSMSVDVPPYTRPTFKGFKNGKLYRLKSALPAFYTQQSVEKSIYLDYEDSKTKWATHNATNVNELFLLTNANTGWPYISAKEMNTGNYLSTPSNISTTSSVLYADSLGDDQFNIKSGNQIYHARNHGNGATTHGPLMSYRSGLNSASAWYIEEVDAIKLRIGDAGYASVYYPFSVKVPNLQGLDVYQPTRVDNNGRLIVLTKVHPGTTVLAQTPLIVKGIPGLYSFEIDYDKLEVASEEDPLFKGVTAPDFIPSNAYILYNDPKKGIGMYKVNASGNQSTKKLGANRVYYMPAENRSAPASVYFKFEDHTTNIQYNTTDNIDNTLYDVSGKKASSHQKGIVITTDGKKTLKVK